MNAPATEIRKGRKYDQVVAGARAVFMSEGFEGASVDDIARAAGVSKATLYSYFPDKRLLFMEVITTQCRINGDEALSAIDFSLPVRDVLLQIGDRHPDIPCLRGRSRAVPRSRTRILSHRPGPRPDRAMRLSEESRRPG